ncbi:MAG: hypothetical protein U5R31_04890 [Acidimicrobiia bacterium]|nr:hypothetical protein [Acidimicrobiia bacterium]
MTGNDPTRPTGAAPANPALAALGDRLEQAAGTAIATGGTPPGGRSWARLAFLPVLALFVAAGVLIATLVPGGGGRSAEAAVVSAAQATTDASTGRFAVTVAAEGGGVGRWRCRSTAPTTWTPTGTGRPWISAPRLAGQPGADLLEGQDLSVDTVIDGSDVYVRLGPAAELFGAEWLRMSVPEMAEQQPAPSLAPGAFLDSLEGVADLEEVGREAVRGSRPPTTGGRSASRRRTPRCRPTTASSSSRRSAGRSATSSCPTCPSRCGSATTTWCGGSPSRSTARAGGGPAGLPTWAPR